MFEELLLFSFYVTLRVIFIREQLFMRSNLCTSFFQRYRKFFIIWVFLIIILCFFNDSTFASNTGTTTNPWWDDDASTIIQAINGFFKILSALLWALTAFVSLFLYPGWTNGTLFGLTWYLKEIWILISNLVYFIFAGVLIVIAFMNIIGKWDGTWELKQAMPKFIVWVLIVPFSWFLVQFILSLTAILTVGVLTLPFDVFKDSDFFKEIKDWDMKICTEIKVNLTDWLAGDTSSTVGEDNKLFWEAITCDEKIWLGTYMNQWGEGLKNSIFGVVSIYTYSVLGLDNLDTLAKWELKNIGQIFDAWLKFIFDIIFVVVYFLLMVALFLALFVRWVWLWVYMMLSPTFWLLYFFWKWSDWVWETKFSIKGFVDLALVPVYVSAALSFWLVFLFIASNGMVTSGALTDGRLEVWWTWIQFEWEFWDTQKDWALFAWGWSAIGKMIVEIFWIVILWIAVMAALRSSETTRAVVEPIAAFGKSVWELAAKAPTYAPIIPLGQWGMSATALSSAWAQVKNTIAWAQTSIWSDRGSAFTKNVLWIWDNEISRLTNAMSKHSATLEWTAQDNQEQMWYALSTLLDSTDAQILWSNSEFKKKFNEYMSSIFREDYTDAMQSQVTTASRWNIDDRLHRIFQELGTKNGTALHKAFGKEIPNLELVQQRLENSDATTWDETSWGSWAAAAGWAAWTTTTNISTVISGITVANAWERAGTFDSTITVPDLTGKLPDELSGEEKEKIVEAFREAWKIEDWEESVASEEPAEREPTA